MGYQFKTVSIGIDEHNNPAVYKYLNHLEETGKIDHIAREIVLKSFSEEKLPVISRAKLKRLMTTSASPEDVYAVVHQLDHPLQIVLYKYEIMLVVKKAKDRDRELENLLARFLRLFL